MKPIKTGQIAKFHTPFQDEDPNQLYVVTEIFDEVERPRAEIKALHTGLPFPPINKVYLDDLELVSVNTDELLGHTVTINKSDYSQIEGKVIKVSEQEIILDLTKGVKGVETNVWITILDKNGIEHKGTLFIN
jgi:hypothetical protein